MTTIQRRVLGATETVEVPENHAVCEACKGKGSLTKYDRGWRSLTYDPSLDAPSPCWSCGGSGYVSAYV